MLYRVHLDRVVFEITTLVVKDTDCIGSCKSNYDPVLINRKVNASWNQITCNLLPIAPIDDSGNSHFVDV